MSKILSEEIHLRGNIIESLEGELTKVRAENVKLKNQVRQFHIDTARFIEHHKEDFITETEKQQMYLDKLKKRINDFDAIINTHNKLGGV